MCLERHGPQGVVVIECPGFWSGDCPGFRNGNRSVCGNGFIPNTCSTRWLRNAAIASCIGWSRRAVVRKKTGPVRSPPPHSTYPNVRSASAKKTSTLSRKRGLFCTGSTQLNFYSSRTGSIEDDKSSASFVARGACENTEEITKVLMCEKSARCALKIRKKADITKRQFLPFAQLYDTEWMKV